MVAAAQISEGEGQVGELLSTSQCLETITVASLNPKVFY